LLLVTANNECRVLSLFFDFLGAHQRTGSLYRIMPDCPFPNGPGS
jgi:hypothetical protein